MNKYKRKFICFCCLLLLALIITSCSPHATNEQTLDVDSKDKIEIITPTITLTPTPSPTPTPSAFDKDIEYLQEWGMSLPSLSSDATLKMDQYLSLLVETYEALGPEIDISKFNPRSEYSNEVKKMLTIDTYNIYIQDEENADQDLDYVLASYFLLKFQDSIQERLYWRSDYTARADDLLKRINVSTALFTWEDDKDIVRTYSLSDLLDVELEEDHIINRLLLAEMLIKAYEDIVEEIPIEDISKLNDTDNIYAMKASQYILWAKDGNFEPLKNGKWNDWEFTSGEAFNIWLIYDLKLENSKVPYGAIVSALSSLLRGYEGIEQSFIEEKIVLNERPYEWYVNQHETGEYGMTNCMPACVEMSMLYQGHNNAPSTEDLRNEYPEDGLGWNNILAEEVMRQYGLNFETVYEVELDDMINYLDEGNILYIMFSNFEEGEGHASIIKGYWKFGENLNFIISDPVYDTLGPFGYPEYIIDAQTMVHNMRRYIPLYFSIAPEQ